MRPVRIVGAADILVDIVVADTAVVDTRPAPHSYSGIPALAAVGRIAVAERIRRADHRRHCRPLTE